MRGNDGFEFGDQNEARKGILDFVVAFDLLQPTLYLICKDRKVILGESLTSQHMLMVLEICIKGQHNDKTIKDVDTTNQMVESER